MKDTIELCFIFLKKKYQLTEDNMNPKKRTDRNTNKSFTRFFQIPGILMLISEIWKQLCITFVLNGGSYRWWYFPFQLCSIPMYILLIFPYIKKARLRNAFLTFLMTFCLLGGIIVFADTSGLHYPIAALTVHSYLWHILLITIGILAGIVRIGEAASRASAEFALEASLKPAAPLTGFFDAVLLYLGACLTAELINLICSRYGMINMFYINPLHSMDQIVFEDLVPILGNGAAIALYILATVIGAWLLFLIWKGIYRAAISGFKRQPK